MLAPPRNNPRTSGSWSAFCELATRLGGHEAILAPDREPLTYAALWDQMVCIKDSLNERGIGRGDRVAVALPNGPEMAVSFLSLTSSTIFAPLNPACTDDEFRRYLNRLKPQALLTRPGTLAAKVADSMGITTLTVVVDQTAPAGSFRIAGGSERRCTDPSWNTDEDVGLVLQTSGTTAIQKLVPMRQRHYVTYAKHINDFYRLDASDRCLVMNPMFHGSGLKGSLLVPLINGSSVVCLPSADVDAFFDSLDRYRPTWYVAAYTIQKAILEAAASRRDVVARARLRFIRTSSGWLHPELQRGLEKTFRAPVIQQYSSSETCAITCNPLPPRERKLGSCGIPIVNEVKVMSPDGAFLAPGQEGEVVVRGPTVFDGYLDDPEATEAAFVDGWYRTGDLGHFDTDGYLMLSGRAKDVINRGGEKISPAEVESVLLSHSAVREAKVFGTPHPSLGEEVIAAVVLDDEIPTTETDLKRFVREALSDFKVPRQITFFDAFPLAPTSKVDTEVLRRACESSRQESPQLDTTSSIEKEVASLWRAVLGIDDVGRNDDFFLLGGDSLKAVELSLALAAKFDLTLPADSIYGKASTVTGMVKAIVSSEDTAEETIPSRQRAVSWEDFSTALTLAALAPIAWLIPRKIWPRIASRLARAHVFLRGSRSWRLAGAVQELETPISAQSLEQRLLSGVYQDVLITLREQLRASPRPDVRLHGAEHLEAALAAGRGAVLWSCSSTFSGLMAKKALYGAGMPLVSLRSAAHPYSSSKFGMRVLNPIRTRVEDRYLAGSVSVFEWRGGRALAALGAHLDQNRLVVISANGAEGVPLEMPFLGGTLKLALGAPTLSLLHDAPLLPIFTVPDEDGSFDVVVEPRIVDEEESSTRDKASRMTRRYAELLERYIRRHPTVWRRWFADNTWTPSSA